ELRPNAAEQTSLGQRPRLVMVLNLFSSPERAEYNGLCRPFRARSFLRNVVPGRCPGLVCCCPFGASLHPFWAALPSLQVCISAVPCRLTVVRRQFSARRCCREIRSRNDPHTSQTTRRRERAAG